MKAQLFDSKGDKKGDIELPSVFNQKVREDIVLKYFDAERSNTIQEHSTFSEAGKRHSAAGTISHKRHEWKGHYGKGIARVPRKAMWRRGTQFYWIATEVSGTRGGRKAHPPKINGREKKINKNEMLLALKSAISATANPSFVQKRYSSISKITTAPFVIESLPQKTKDFISILRKLDSTSFDLMLREKEVRAGKGKQRGRKYKSNAGLLVVVGKDESSRFKGVETRTAKELNIKDLYPLGRLTLYTKKALEEIKNDYA